MRRVKTRIMLMAALWVLASATLVAGEPQMVTVTPKASKAPLLNPGKGWVLGWYPWTNPPEDLKFGNLGYTRFEWSEIEPEEGHFNWQPIDTLISSWAALGKQCAFGVMCTNTGVNRYVTPRWVFEAGAPVRIWEEKEGVLQFLVWGGPQGGEHVHGEQTWEVITKPIDLKPSHRVEVADYHHPVFLEKLRNFLKAMAERYDGNPHIAYIDIRSYLNWGEQFSKRHVDLHLGIFKKTRLCQSCPHYGEYPEFDWAAQQGIAIRRDGIGGWSDGRECARAFGYAPAVFELGGDYEFIQKKGWWRNGQMLREAVENGKPSYIALPVIPGGRSFLTVYKDQLPLIEEITNRMGYHFVLNKAEYPGIISAKAKSTMRLTWQNKGVAPIYVPCVVAVGLLDDRGQVVDRCWPTECKPASWYPNKELVEKATLSFPRANPGTYNIAVGLFHYIGDQRPAIRLGIDGKTVDGWHVLGQIKTAEAGKTSGTGEK